MNNIGHLLAGGPGLKNVLSGDLQAGLVLLGESFPFGC